MCSSGGTPQRPFRFPKKPPTGPLSILTRTSLSQLLCLCLQQSLASCSRWPAPAATGLPPTECNYTVLCIVNRFPKVIHFIRLLKLWSALPCPTVSEPPATPDSWPSCLHGSSPWMSVAVRVFGIMFFHCPRIALSISPLSLQLHSYMAIRG